jgi:uncharacterized protein (DUF305 family)
VIDPVALRTELAGTRPVGRGWRAVRLPEVIGVVLLVSAATAVLLWIATNRPPADDSVEAGFARDMMVHHDQAVAMALLIRDRTADPRVKTLATDILLTQENQIGQILGWLNVWGLPATGADPPMTWMGHQVMGRMPGMATPEELANLERLSGRAADEEFLRLMIRHHQAGVAMAEAARERSENAQVNALATAIVTGQEAEMTAMDDLLRQKERAAGGS